MSYILQAIFEGLGKILISLLWWLVLFPILWLISLPFVLIVALFYPKPYCCAVHDLLGAVITFWFEWGFCFVPL